MKKFIGISNNLGKYIFLTIDGGYKEIKDLSSSSCIGVLESIKPAWLNDDTYMPHMTAGQFNTDDDLKNALSKIRKKEYEFNTRVEKVSVEKVSVEIIDENEDSIIEMEVKLNQ